MSSGLHYFSQIVRKDLISPRFTSLPFRFQFPLLITSLREIMPSPQHITQREERNKNASWVTTCGIWTNYLATSSKNYCTSHCHNFDICQKEIQHWVSTTQYSCSCDSMVLNTKKSTQLYFVIVFLRSGAKFGENWTIYRRSSSQTMLRAWSVQCRTTETVHTVSIGRSRDTLARNYKWGIAGILITQNRNLGDLVLCFTLLICLPGLQLLQGIRKQTFQTVHVNRRLKVVLNICESVSLFWKMWHLIRLQLSQYYQFYYN